MSTDLSKDEVGGEGRGGGAGDKILSCWFKVERDNYNDNWTELIMRLVIYLEITGKSAEKVTL